MASSSRKSQVLRYTLLSKDVLNADDMDLYELVHLSGVVMDPNVYKIILDLLRMNVTPLAIEKMLKSMVSAHYKKHVDTDSDNVVHSSSSSTVSSSSIPKSRHRPAKTHSDRIK